MNVRYFVLSCLVMHSMTCKVLKPELLIRVDGELTFVFACATRYLKKILFCLMYTERHINILISIWISHHKIQLLCHILKNIYSSVGDHWWRYVSGVRDIKTAQSIAWRLSNDLINEIWIESNEGMHISKSTEVTL